jgi:glycosyltransferase involved in cell wall biosynthesis
MPSLWESALLASCVLWICGLIYLSWAVFYLAQFHRLQFHSPQEWPALSVIIPACNEAANIESAVETLLRQDYPNLELILVDDRSTDGTGAIIDRLAARDRRIRALHVQALPDGWLGKVHALERAVEIASGDWLLFTDADVHFAAGTLRRAVGWAIDRQLDHLALAPLSLQPSFLLDIVVHTFMLLFLIGTRAAGLNRPGSRGIAGVGAFNLIRRAAFQRTPGFSWLRLEPCDDVGLGLMIKRAGGRSFFAFAQRHLTVVWYASVSAMFKGLEKNLFGATANYRWWVTLVQVIGIYTMAAAPMMALFLGLTDKHGLLLYTGLIALALHWAFSLAVTTEGWRSRLSLMLAPVGLWMIGAMMAHAAWKCLAHNGIDWRGTHYPLNQLRGGQRVKLGSMQD